MWARDVILKLVSDPMLLDGPPCSALISFIINILILFFCYRFVDAGLLTLGRDSQQTTSLPQRPRPPVAVTTPSQRRRSKRGDTEKQKRMCRTLSPSENTHIEITLIN